MWAPIYGQLTIEHSPLHAALIAEDQKDPSIHSFLHITDAHLSLILDMHRGSVSRYVNDGKKAGKAVNLEMVFDDTVTHCTELGPDMVRMRFVTDVMAGEEAFTDYGPKYWRK